MSHDFVFCWIFENNCSRGWGFSTIFLSQGSGFRTVFVPGRVGNLPFQKIPWGFAWGGWSGLELTDTLRLSMTTERTRGFHRPIARRPVMLLGASCSIYFTSVDFSAFKCAKYGNVKNRFIGLMPYRVLTKLD